MQLEKDGKRKNGVRDRNTEKNLRKLCSSKSLPRPARSAYTLFYQVARKQLSIEKPELSFQQFPTVCSKIWREMPPEQHALWQEDARRDMERYQRELLEMVAQRSQSSIEAKVEKAEKGGKGGKKCRKHSSMSHGESRLDSEAHMNDCIAYGIHQHNHLDQFSHAVIPSITSISNFIPSFMNHNLSLPLPTQTNAADHNVNNHRNNSNNLLYYSICRENGDNEMSNQDLMLSSQSDVERHQHHINYYPLQHGHMDMRHAIDINAFMDSIAAYHEGRAPHNDVTTSDNIKQISQYDSSIALHHSFEESHGEHTAEDEGDTNERHYRDHYSLLDNSINLQDGNGYFDIENILDHDTV